MVAEGWLEVRGRAAGGSLRGTLRAGEDRVALTTALERVADRVLSESLPLLVHERDRAGVGAAELHAVEAHKRAVLGSGRLKRYVVPLDTVAGPRILKISETTSLGNALLGVVGSVARREHHNQRRAQGLGIAVSETVGFLELRRGWRLLRALQVQTPRRDDLEPLGSFLARDRERHGDAADERLGVALAEAHRVPFFHADLKGFHAFVEPQAVAAADYRLRWLDLARVSFRLSRRQRIINLYQALRFLLPPEPSAQERFVIAYCRASGWCADDPSGALSRVRRFLAHKLRTHPVVE